MVIIKRINLIPEMMVNDHDVNRKIRIFHLLYKKEHHKGSKNFTFSYMICFHNAEKKVLEFSNRLLEYRVELTFTVDDSYF